MKFTINYYFWKSYDKQDSWLYLMILKNLNLYLFSNFRNYLFTIFLFSYLLTNQTLYFVLFYYLPRFNYFRYEEWKFSLYLICQMKNWNLLESEHEIIFNLLNLFMAHLDSVNLIKFLLDSLRYWLSFFMAW
jgi:hypothetical protein